MENSVELKRQLLNEYSPFAAKAAKRASYKWDIQEDDVYQELMMNAWIRSDWALSGDCPIAMLRSTIKFVIGHIVQNRYWRKGNGETDQLDDTFETVDTTSPDPELRTDISRAIEKLDDNDKEAFQFILEGKTVKSFADENDMPVTSANYRFNRALVNFKAHMEGSKDVKGANYGKEATLQSDCGKIITGTMMHLVRETGLSKGSVSNLIAGRRDRVNEWRRLDA